MEQKFVKYFIEKGFQSIDPCWWVSRLADLKASTKHTSKDGDCIMAPAFDFKKEEIENIDEYKFLMEAAEQSLAPFFNSKEWKNMDYFYDKFREYAEERKNIFQNKI